MRCPAEDLGRTTSPVAASEAASGAVEEADDAAAVDGAGAAEAASEGEGAVEALADGVATGGAAEAAPTEAAATGAPAVALATALAEGREAELVVATVGRAWRRRNKK